ncbi:MAG TPA: SAM-dependent methyltransferase [Pyrinomonadaceae bacterium]|nr:SAM-dependent methyltransferase [Pyrinomonadaceae bacterium]
MTPTSGPELTPTLAQRLRARIEREGPISFRDWMQAALYDEHEGYYCRLDRIPQGRAGDYRTAPESSPLFAATFAWYFSKLFAELFFEMGSPPTWTIFEAGAGGGEFARGVLNSFQSHYPEVFSATTYVIDEVSADARARSAARASEFGDRVTFRSLAEVAEPAVVGIVFSNELIDAFPVHRVIMRNGGLRELCVGLDQNDFVWVERDPSESVAEYFGRAELRLSEGQIAEINLEAERFISRAAGLFAHGYVVTVDYGAERSELLDSPDRFNGTLRAFHHHQLITNVLARPGEQDLTTTVDWTQIKEVGGRVGLRAVRLESLDHFLLSEGLLQRLSEMVAQTKDQVEALRLSTSAREMIMPNGLAASFQVLVQEKLSLASRDVLR